MRSLSVVIPAYNEEKNIQKAIRAISEFLSKQKINYEIIVVDDGSKDRTVEKVKALHNAHVKIIGYPKNQGKGAAVKAGMLHAEKDYVLFTDADQSTPISELKRFEDFEQFDIIIGSRALKRSNVTKHQPFFREFSGKVFNKIVQALTVKRIKDTQCGFKLFKKHVAHDVFSRVQMKGFTFDVEALYIAQKLGYRIKELPVTWHNDEDTRVDFFRDSIKMFFDLIKIRKKFSKLTER